MTSLTGVRPATSQDVCRLMALEEQAFGAEAWSVRLVRAAIGDALVGESGWVVITVAGDVADLQRIAVCEPRCGEGSILLAAAVERARERGADRVLLEVREDNEAARAFYAARGFVEIDRRRRYYRDGADALVLQLPLTGGSTSGSGA